MLAEKPPISIAVCTVHHGLPVERTMAYPISVGAFTFDHGKHPWWPQGSQKTPGNFEEKKEFCRDSMVNGPAPRFVVDLGRLCFILVLFDAENQVYLILLAVFLLDMELKPKKTWTKFSTYDKSSLKACHLLRKKQTGFSNYARDQHAEVLFHGELHGPSNSVSSVEPATVPCCFWTHEGGFGLW